jgi:hypothetical protein
VGSIAANSEKATENSRGILGQLRTGWSEGPKRRGGDAPTWSSVAASSRNGALHIAAS